MEINLTDDMLIARLPATPVTVNMDQEMRAIAKRQNISIARLQRKAFSFFLSQYVSKADYDVNLTDERQLSFLEQADVADPGAA